MKLLVGSYTEVPTGAGATEIMGPDERRRAIIFPCFTGIAYTVWPGANPNLNGIVIPPNTAALHLRYDELGDLICAPWMANTSGPNLVRFIEAREIDVPSPADSGSPVPSPAPDQAAPMQMSGTAPDVTLGASGRRYRRTPAGLVRY